MSIPLFLLTFNCGKLKIGSADFTEALQKVLPDSPSDLFVFGFQEVCSILDGSFPRAVRKHVIDINRSLLHALKSKYNNHEDVDFSFTTIGIHHVGAIAMIAVTPYASKFGPCRFADVSCGYANSSLKGGVGIRVKYTLPDSPPTDLTFVTAHLSASEGAVYYARRLQDIQTIMRAMDFGDGFSFLKPNSHTFFMGDLNFRTTQNLEQDQAVLERLSNIQDSTETDTETAHHDETTKLVAKYDELTQGRVNGEVFSGFDEACISFRPTYKFHLKTAIYNSKRCPSWCDRILYQATYNKGASILVHEYGSVSSYLGSDHRPVFLNISVPLEAPESIIAPNGYLVILPVRSHLEHNNKDFDPNVAVSGPTQIYMKFSAIDRLTQCFLRKFADCAIGYGLWFGTTPKGRLALLGLALLAWVVYAI